MGGAELIAAERQRQIDEEGYTPERDSRYRAPQLARAAVCYATPADQRWITGRAAGDVSGRGTWVPGVPGDWPWGAYDWKPTPDDRVRELVKAGALLEAERDRIAAEIDRLLAVEVKPGD